MQMLNNDDVVEEDDLELKREVERLLQELKEKDEQIRSLEELREADQRVQNLMQEELREARTALKAHESVEVYMAEERQITDAEVEAHRRLSEYHAMELRNNDAALKAHEMLTDFVSLELRNKNSSLNRILEINRSISSILNINILLQQILVSVVDSLNADRSVLFMNRDQKMYPRILYRIGKREIESDEFFIPRSEIKKSYHEQISRHYSYNQNDSSKKIQSFLCMPLLYDSRVLGVLYVDIVDSKKPAFREEDLHLAEIFCGQAAISIHNAKLYSQLQEQMITDNFLGIGNRRRLEQDLRADTKLSLALINIDNFSFINGAYGNNAGDYVLVEFVSRVQKVLVQNSELFEGSLYRINADEFAVLSKRSDFPVKVLKELVILELRSDPLAYNEIIINITFSIGVVENENEDLLRKAHMALKSARNLGKGRYAFYEKGNDLASQYRDYLFWSNKVRSSIAYDRVVPYFHAIYDNKNGVINKFEALVRIREDNALFLPGKFLESARHTGILPHITVLMIDKTFEIFKSNNYDFTINFSAEDLAIDNFLHLLQSKLKTTGIDPGRVTFEILEGISEDKDSDALKFLKELKNLGFKLAIDDFGQGYSNFSRILSTDIDFIKIDGAFVRSMEQDEYSYSIVKAITEFAHSIGVKVVAEHVHKKEIQDLVVNMGIDFSQGDYIAEPTNYI